MRSEASLTSPFARLGASIARRPRAVLGLFAVVITAMGFYGASVEEHLPAAVSTYPAASRRSPPRRRRRRFGVGAADVLVLYRNPEGDVRDAELRLADHRRPRSGARGRGRGGRDDRLRHQPADARLARRQRDAGDRVARRRAAREKLAHLQAHRAAPARHRATRRGRRSAASSPSRCWCSRSAREDATAAEMIALPIAALLDAASSSAASSQRCCRSRSAPSRWRVPQR